MAAVKLRHSLVKRDWFQRLLPDHDREAGPSIAADLDQSLLGPIVSRTTQCTASA